MLVDPGQDGEPGDDSGGRAAGYAGAGAGQQRTVLPVTDRGAGRVDRPGWERDNGGLVALAEDGQGVMPAILREIGHVGGAG